jgi:integrase/recombinase XerD
MLRAVERLCPELAPYVALSLFAGIRPEELLKLKWADIGESQIRIGPEVAKTRDQRFVRILPNLAAWLTAYRGAGKVAPCWPKALGKRLRQARASAGIGHWPKDVLRHCFATFHIVLNQNAQQTAHEMGHASLNMLYQHYRALATPEEARRYFALYPRKGRGTCQDAVKARAPRKPRRKTER